MKKLSTLIVAFLLTAGMAYAQNNDASVSQAGNGNNAAVDQQGSNHEVVIDQDTWGTGHNAVVNQNSGSFNFVNILQDQPGANALVDQVGSENTVGLKQSGPNIADIDQIGNGNTLGSYSNLENNAYQKNGVSGASDMNWLYLDQTGNGNAAGVWQEHHGEVTINQAGDNNVSRAYQTGSAGGALNTASTSIYGDDNFTDTYQFGEGNAASISFERFESSSNIVGIEQRGNSNNASFQARGNGSTVSITQLGDGNYTEYDVKYGDDNQITDINTGNNNRTRLGIIAEYGFLSSGNIVSVTKTGDQNYFRGAIRGDDNSIDVIQTGSNNWVGTDWKSIDGVNITGDLNTAKISQLSDGNMAAVGMTGNNNTATVSQN